MAISSTRLYALFDILTHHQAYSETRDLKELNTITHFGHPLEEKTDQPSAPLIQALIEGFLVVLPGLRDVPKDFWQSRIKDMLSAFARADLSESYDKGSIGIRKTLATACAAIVEFCARGSLGGYRRREAAEAKQTYDLDNHEDLAKAWDDFLQQIVYGDLIERFFATAASTEKLTDHEPLIQATHEYVLIMCDVSLNTRILSNFIIVWLLFSIIYWSFRLEDSLYFHYLPEPKISSHGFLSARL